MFKLQSCDIKEFPFHEYCNTTNPRELQQIAQNHRLSNYNSWMLPQILAHYGSWTLELDSEGRIDPKPTAHKNVQTPWAVGLWRVVTQLPRSSLVGTQNRPEFARYGSLTPLILAGAKRHQGIQYQQWRLTPDSALVHPQLLAAVFAEPTELTTERLLELRQLGLEIRGKGTWANPLHRWCLQNMQGTELQGKPALLGTMLTQIWLAHPDLRDPLMILDPQQWDHTPEPLVSAEVLLKKPGVGGLGSKIDFNRMPWE